MLYAPPRRRSSRRRGRFARAPVAMGAGGVVVLTLGAFVGFWAADSLHRWSSTLAADAKVPAGFTDVATYNSVSVDAPVSWHSIAWQGGLTLLSFFAGGMLKPTWAKLLFYGMGVGAGVHVLSQVATHYIILPLFRPKAGDTTGAGWGPRAYMHEIQSQQAFAGTGTPMPGSLAGPPPRGAARQAPPIRALPAHQPTRVPATLLAGRVVSPQGTLAAPPPVTVPNLANGNCPPGSTTVVNPDNLDMPWCVPPAATTPPPPPPRSNIPLHFGGGPPPPGTPPPSVQPPPSFSNPPAPPMTAPPVIAGSPCGATPPGLTAAPCCGQSPCGCAQQPSAMGQPPSMGEPAHPFFRNLLASQSQPRRRAA